jgi:hypothetical protein
MRPLGQQVLLEELWGLLGMLPEERPALQVTQPVRLLGMLPELLEVRLVGQQELLAPQPVQRGVLQATLAELRLVFLVA